MKKKNFDFTSLFKISSMLLLKIKMVHSLTPSLLNPKLF